jgi:hypothetical protein
MSNGVQSRRDIRGVAKRSSYGGATTSPTCKPIRSIHAIGGPQFFISCRAAALNVERTGNRIDDFGKFDQYAVAHRLHDDDRDISDRGINDLIAKLVEVADVFSSTLPDMRE